MGTGTGTGTGMGVGPEFCPDKMKTERKLFTFLCFTLVKGDKQREGLLTALT